MPRAGQPVGEPGRRVEQRDHRVEVAVGRRAPVAAPGADRRPPLGQPAGPPDRPEHVLGGGAGPGDGLPVATAAAGHRVGRARPTAGRTAASSAGSRSASTSRSPEGGGRPPAAARARSPCRSRRSASGSAPPSGECSSATAASSSSRSGRSAQRSSSSSGAIAGWACSGRSSASVTVGTPAWCSARRSGGAAGACGRPDDHRHPRPRHAAHAGAPRAAGGPRTPPRSRPSGTCAPRRRRPRSPVEPAAAGAAPARAAGPPPAAVAAHELRRVRYDAAQRHQRRRLAVGASRNRSVKSATAARIGAAEGERRRVRVGERRPGAPRRRPPGRSRSIWAGSVSASSST